MSEVVQPAALRFEFRDDNGRLIAHYDPAGTPCPLDRENFLAAIADAGFGALYVKDDAIERIASMAKDAQAPFILEVAERRNGRCEVIVSDDKMTAWLNVFPPFGGANATREQVDAALAEREVVSGIQNDEIVGAIADGKCERRRIARGRPAQPGVPTSFESLLPKARKRGPRVNERGRADYREVSTLVIVHPGDDLMRRTPAKPGIDGENILGEAIPAPPIEDIPWSEKMVGAAPSESDPDLLVALRSGQPVLMNDGVEVEPTITLPSVDLVSGNIEFDGTVNVTGDVSTGMQIHATGDIFVNGTVEAAEIEAGGDIVVRAGVIGHADKRGGATPARLTSKGNINVRFCENTVIRADGDIQVDTVAVHSELTAAGRIIVGKPGERRSQIIGGVAQAGTTLAAGTLGSSAGVRTRLSVGYHPGANNELAGLRIRIEQNELQRDNLEKIIAFKPDKAGRDLSEMKAKAERTLAACMEEHAAMLARVEELKESMQIADNAEVAVGQAIHPGVELQLGNASWKNLDTLGKGVLKLNEDRVEFVAG